jgi:hypothetical protein
MMMRDNAMLTSILLSNARRARAVLSSLRHVRKPAAISIVRDRDVGHPASYTTDWGTTVLSYDNVY